MNKKELLIALEGVQTIESIAKILSTSRQMAIYYVHRLRKEGYVRSKRLSNNVRVYNISTRHKLGGQTPYSIINQHSPIKVQDQGDYYIYGDTLKIEEVIIFALKKQSVRLLIASLSLFKKVKDFDYLFQLAEKNNLARQTAAIYELSRKYVKTRKAPLSILRKIKPKKDDEFKYIINGITSEGFGHLKEKWRVFIPITEKDLEVYENDLH